MQRIDPARFKTSRISRVSSKTITTPEPSGKPAARKSSNVIFTSRCSEVANAPAAPPNRTACKLLSICQRHLPSRAVHARSHQMEFHTILALHIARNAEQFGAGDFSVPILRYSAEPLEMINGTLQSVSTLLMTVGLPNNPCVVGKGGFTRGKPRFPFDRTQTARSPRHKYRRQRRREFQYQRKSSSQGYFHQAIGFPGFVQCIFKNRHNVWIFTANINISLARADGIRRDHIPSMVRCGSSSNRMRSLNVPGSDSSALQMTYF